MSYCRNGACINQAEPNSRYCERCGDFMKRRIERSIDNGKFEYEDDIFCPYCGHVQTDLFEVGGAYGDGEHEINCQNCNEEFTLVTYVSYNYSTYVKEEE